jgi:hypothetical protein
VAGFEKPERSQMFWGVFRELVSSIKPVTIALGVNICTECPQSSMLDIQGLVSFLPIHNGVGNPVQAVL